MAVDRSELRQLIPALRRYSRGLAGDSATADDMVQDCLLLALHHEHQFRGGRLAPWVFAILSNLGRSRFRAQRRAPPMAELDEVADGGSDPALRVSILSALDALPEEQRKALLLTAIEGFTYQEAAEIFGVPVGTIMSRIWRARTTLAEVLDGNEPVPLRRVK
jgi:RNA polymerase sigma-70 factor (ECF subfamily)